MKLIKLFVLLSILSCSRIDYEEEEREIRNLWDKAFEYACNGDWENYANCWDHSSNVQIMHTDQGEWLIGWEKIGEKYEQLLNSGMRCSVPKNDMIINISASGDMAWATIDLIIQFDDSLQTKSHVWETGVFEKIDGEWKIVHGMVSVPVNLIN